MTRREGKKTPAAVSEQDCHGEFGMRRLPIAREKKTRRGKAAQNHAEQHEIGKQGCQIYLAHPLPCRGCDSGTSLQLPRSHAAWVLPLPWATLQASRRHRVYLPVSETRMQITESPSNFNIQILLPLRLRSHSHPRQCDNGTLPNPTTRCINNDKGNHCAADTSVESFRRCGCFSPDQRVNPLIPMTLTRKRSHKASMGLEELGNDRPS
ncbi:hypothetical protein B0T21DRAFT_77436 [Apiosordaria backusii]|uniref:Uncharacterized protein n=1 Tax=Apiosordaria backusii TaxID=314023 RepID=A0AA40A763_9PEZI|nr:hypothetical protein B0T21DRAFT_77436 [Apiosordaria backusii]